MSARRGFLAQGSGVLLAALLAGCTATGLRQGITARPPRSTLRSFVLEGRAVIRQGSRADSVHLSWEHSEERDTISFANMLGMQLAELQRDAQGARWLSADGQQAEAYSADALIARLTHDPVPINSLALWVTGRAAPDAALQFDAQGRMLGAQEAGWTVRILAYENEQANALPAQLEIERGALRIRLAIESWQF
jgi:outer membrane lipoprotein LolB